MAGEPELHYFNGRGRIESIGWLLAAAGVERHKSDVPASTNGGHRRNDTGADQTRTILNYMAPKYNLYRRDLKERALIDMYTEGMADLNEMIIVLPLCPPDQKDAKIALIKERTTDCYLPMFEKVLKSHGQDYLVGNMLSRADIHLVELLYYVEELDPSLLANFPLLKNQQSPHHEEVSVAWQPEEASH